MSSFLFVDTSGKYLSVLLYANGKRYQSFLEECAMKHSVLLMDEIDKVFGEAKISPKECDFFGAVNGPGSFTGIRIGISTIKGFCAALHKEALSVTSFDALAYAEEGVKVLALVDAGHSNFYACAYDEEKNVVRPPAFVQREEVEKMICDGFMPVSSEVLFEGCKKGDPMEGLFKAVPAKEGQKTFNLQLLSAIYLRKSSAEEKLL